MALRADASLAPDTIRSPELSFIAAIILQSVEDLTNPDAAIRDEARAFWTSSAGTAARTRREYLALLDIDDTAARGRIAHLLDNAAIRERRFAKHCGEKPAFRRLLEFLPDGEFTYRMVRSLDHDMPENTLRAAFQQLKDHELIRKTIQTRHGAKWARTDWIMKAVSETAV